jgi:lipopolysaccharide/colanic/teichoic acid biosynthesis glycosyltransferase
MTSTRVKPRRGYALKRLFDIVFSGTLLIVTAPLLLGCMLAVWLQDRHSPFYKAPRVARGGGDFTMIKIRSMVIDADSSGVNSTGAADRRITAVGRFIRRYKIDELSQFLNVLAGSMSVVGPRPQSRAWGVDLYTETEMEMLSVRPGITDLASIVFSDEGDILAEAAHADLEYNRIIRPWKSRLCLFYIQHASLGLDLRICWLTLLAVVNKPKALTGVVEILQRHGAEPRLIEICRRAAPLPAAPPPGATEIETGIRGAGRA